jgi:hypothetical protein
LNVGAAVAQVEACNNLLAPVLSMVAVELVVLM